MTVDLVFAQPDDLPAAPDIVARQLPGRPAGVLSLGSVEDVYGARIPVGVDLSNVTIGGGTFGRAELADLLRRIVAAGRAADAYAAREAELDA